MREIKFRLLEADDIECRVARVSNTGVQLLLYKNARCDMNMLDEAVGAANWQRTHEVVNGNLFCSVGINVSDDDQDPYWVWKQDVGTESNTEKEKGEASDSFKRACVNWGIGRELYTAPFIWINSSQCDIEGGKKCKDSFSVSEIGYDDKRRITNLQIINDKTGKVVYPSYGKTQKAQEKPKEAAKEMVTKGMITSLENTLKEAHISQEKFLNSNNMKSLAEMNIQQYKNTMDALNAKIEKRKEKEKIDDEGLPFA